MLKSNIEVDIIINNKIAPLYYDEHGDAFIEGREGSDYSIRVKNKTNGRVLVVPSVDGLSVMDGKPATMDSKGYILDSYATINIPGWKLNKEEVAKFTFGKPSKSYAVKSGHDATNVGIIGLAVFKEKVTYYSEWTTTYPVKDWQDRFSPIWISGQPIITYGASSKTVSSSNTSYNVDIGNIGTEFGKSEEFKTTSVSFEKGSLHTVFEIFYDDYSGLMERGIKVNEYKPKKIKPSAFTGQGCVPPSDWTK